MEKEATPRGFSFFEALFLGSGLVFKGSQKESQQRSEASGLTDSSPRVCFLVAPRVGYRHPALEDPQSPGRKSSLLIKRFHFGSSLGLP